MSGSQNLGSPSSASVLMMPNFVRNNFAQKSGQNNVDTNFNNCGTLRQSEIQFAVGNL